MESERTREQLNEEEIIVKKLDEASDMDTEDVVEVSPSLMVSISPDLNIESRDLPVDVPSLQTKSLKIARQDDYCLNSLGEDSPGTPKDAIFDPFAPGPDRLLLTPFSRKYLQKYRTSGFSSSVKREETEQCESDAETSSDEERLLEAVYDDLLEAIISKRADEVSISDDGCKTPTSENLLNDVTETCPDAPVKAARKLKNTSKGLSKKKLDFNTGLRKKLEF